MKTGILTILIFLSLQSFGQTKPKIYFGENGERISEREFIENRDYGKNLDLYFESETTLKGILVARKKFGHLDGENFTRLKSYLTDLTGNQIDSTRNIVINYLSANPQNKEKTTSRSRWNVLDTDYLRKLHKTPNIEQFWIHSPETANLEYYNLDRIDWIEDRDGFFKKEFFPYEIRYGNYLLLKPDGRYYYYLGEHSKHQIWEETKSFFE